MEELVEKAFQEVSSLPEDEKQAFATFILDELRSERKWDKTFEKTQSGLKKLAEEALREDKKGNTKDLNFNNH